MGQKLDEGMLFDILERRRAGKITADEIYWAACNSEIIRWVKGNYKLIDSLGIRMLTWAVRNPEFIHWAQDNREVIDGLRDRRLTTISRRRAPAEIHALDLIPDGWTIAVIDGVVMDRAPLDFDVSKLKLWVELPEDGNPGPTGENELSRRARSMRGDWSLSDGKKMLVNGGKLLTDHFWRHRILLTETILCDLEGAHYIAYLHMKNALEWRCDYHKVNLLCRGDCFACRE